MGSPYGLACGSQDPLDLSPGGPGLFTSSDSSVALASAAMTDDSTQTAEAAAATIRSIVPSPSGDETGLRAYVTGEVGFEADRSEALKTIDEKLLLVTCTVLILLLLAIYRSPLMALVPIFVVSIAYIVAGGITYLFVRAGATTVSGQTTAILIVLMFGAGTDYCLLLVARFRDELQRTADPGEAIERASAHTRPAILSAGAIVVVAMLVLTVADFNATREMGPILALGIAVMVAAGLTLLPAILGVLGRRAFWPVVPRVEAGPRPVPALWVARRPARRPPPRAHRGRGDGHPGPGRARQPRRPGAARLLGGVPHAAGVRGRRGDHQRAVHPRPCGPDRGPHRLRGSRAGHLRTDDRAVHAYPGDVPLGGFGPDHRPGIGAGAGAGVLEDESVLRCRHGLDP